MSKKQIDHKKLLESLMASLTLADNLGDVAEDVSHVAKKMGFKSNIMDWNDLTEFQTELSERGITTLYGSTV